MAIAVRIEVSVVQPATSVALQLDANLHSDPAERTPRSSVTTVAVDPRIQIIRFASVASMAHAAVKTAGVEQRQITAGSAVSPHTARVEVRTSR